MSDAPDPAPLPMSAEGAELERVADERFETKIFVRFVLIVLFVAAVITARTLFV